MKQFLALIGMIILITGCASPAVTLVPTISLPSPTPLAATLTPTPTVVPSPTATLTPAPTPTPAPYVLIGAGDIAFCGDAPEYQGDEQTANLVEKLLAQNPNAAVFTAGDNVYGEGTLAELKNCFGTTWGRFKDKIHPSAGNHDYMTDQGQPYYTYFGEAAGPAGIGYYSYNLGDWHIVALNSNCNDIACGPNSAQVKWFQEDLQSNPQPCTLVYYHHPRFSSGIAGGSGSTIAFWKTAVELGVDVIVNGHDHDYERFAPMDADGNPDPKGVQEFVVGTGGAVLRDFDQIKSNSEVRYNRTHGVIEFQLFPGHYQWTFMPAEESDFTDAGAGTCH